MHKDNAHMYIKLKKNFFVFDTEIIELLNLKKSFPN